MTALTKIMFNGLRHKNENNSEYSYRFLICCCKRMYISVCKQCNVKYTCDIHAVGLLLDLLLLLQNSLNMFLVLVEYIQYVLYIYSN